METLALMIGVIIGVFVGIPTGVIMGRHGRDDRPRRLIDPTEDGRYGYEVLQVQPPTYRPPVQTQIHIEHVEQLHVHAPAPERTFKMVPLPDVQDWNAVRAHLERAY